MADAERWATHSRMSNPKGHANSISALPEDVGILNTIVQGLIVHADWAGEYGLDETKLGVAARITLPIAERLDDVFRRDFSPLDTHRLVEKRSPGTCRDFALVLCSFLRSKGIPARVRCGFAAYFSTGWEDHWVCEYWDAVTQTWRLSDAQIDQMFKKRNRIGFDTADMPREFFVPAGEAWLKCRRAETDPGVYGHGDVKGLWFIKVNVFRDYYVLNNHETSHWDRWRQAPLSRRLVHEHEMALLDDLAAHPEQQLVETLPDWLSQNS